MIYDLSLGGLVALTQISIPHLSDISHGTSVGFFDGGSSQMRQCMVMLCVEKPHQEEQVEGAESSGDGGGVIRMVPVLAAYLLGAGSRSGSGEGGANCGALQPCGYVELRMEQRAGVEGTGYGISRPAWTYRDGPVMILLQRSAVAFPREDKTEMEGDGRGNLWVVVSRTTITLVGWTEDSVAEKSKGDRLRLCEFHRISHRHKVCLLVLLGYSW